MNAKNLMFVSIAILAIVLSVCVSVFTYNEISKVRFTCDVKGNKATYYVDFGDEETMSLLYAHTIYAIKNADSVYKSRKSLSSNTINRRMRNRCDEVARKEEEKKSKNIEAKHDNEYAHKISPELSKKLYDECIAPKVRFSLDSMIHADIASGNYRN